MTWQIHTDISKFTSEYENHLLEKEAHNNMLLQAFSRALQAPSASNAGFTNDSGSLGLLFNGSLIFSHTEDFSVSNLIQSVKDFLGLKPLAMVMGPEQIARDFTREWLQKNKTVRLNHEFSMVLQKIEKVSEIKMPPGQFRRAWLEEVDLLATWLERFAEDTGVPSSSELSSRDLALQMINSKQLFVWGNNRPASMVGIGGSTPKGVRVHSVYTPPEKRGSGLASATVASLSDLQLSSGKEFLVLYSDATKPENSALYQKIGYQPIANHFSYFFSSK